jgi:TetR/AcrR family transcriptional regulator, cholesterol catabolism regulator
MTTPTRSGGDSPWRIETRAHAARPRTVGRKTDILQAATKLFYERGYPATSMQDIADAVGILKGSMYYYVDSKENLLAAVVEDVHQRSLAVLWSAQRVDGDMEVRVRGLIEPLAVFNMENSHALTVFLHELRHLTPERRVRIISERDEFRSYLADLITDGIETGAIAPSVVPPLIADAILGMLDWTYHWYRAHGPDSPQRIAHQWSELILRGFRTPRLGAA